MEHVLLAAHRLLPSLFLRNSLSPSSPYPEGNRPRHDSNEHEQTCQRCRRVSHQVGQENMHESEEEHKHEATKEKSKASPTFQSSRLDKLRICLWMS